MSERTVGVVGCGVISEAHLAAWARTPGFRVRGVIDTNREQAQKRASQFDVPTVFEQLDDLLAECDIIDVCTPPQSHARIAQAAIERGRHLVMEKPMVTDVGDWDRIDAQARAKGSKIAVIHNLKFLQSVQTAKRWVEEGRIGEVLRIQREFLTHASSDRMLVGEGHWSHSLPGGRWFETLPHELYLTHWLVGALELSSVTAICTPSAPFGARADEVSISMRGDRAIGTIHFSANCRENRRMFLLQGTEGRISVDILSDMATLSRTSDSKLRRVIGRPIAEATRVLATSAADRGRYVARRLRKQSAHVEIIQSLGRHLRGEGAEPTPLAEIDYVVRNCDRIGRAIDQQIAEHQQRA